MNKTTTSLFLITLIICTLRTEAIGFTYFDDMLFSYQMQRISQWSFLQITIWQWFALLFGIFINRFFIKSLLALILKYLEKITQKTKTDWDDLVIEALKPASRWVLGCCFWFLWLLMLQISENPMFIFIFLIKLTLSFAVLASFYRLTDVAVSFLSQWMTARKFLFSQQMEHILKRILKILVIVLGALVILQNLGVNVVSVMAGLGLGGLAFALAAKDMCSHFFGSVMIFLDQPFRVGDWVLIGDMEGTVEDIGFRSTRIRTFYDSVVSIPNGALSNMNIDNMGQRQYRRLKAFYSLTYDTPPQKIEEFIDGIKSIIKSHPHTRKDNFHVVFQSYAASSLEIMLYCFLQVPDWGTELVCRQEIHLKILKLAEKLRVDFAFPTRSLHIHSQPPLNATP